MAWHDSPTGCFVYNSNLGELSAERAAATLRQQFAFPCLPVTAIEHCFCLTTSKEHGSLNTGTNPDVVQVSCLLLRNNVELISDFRLARGKCFVGCLVKPISMTVDAFKGAVIN